MKIYVVGSSKNKFLPLDNIREKFLIDVEHKGDNIDFLNPWYCELTGLYYLWKHVDDDIVGLEHYRRYFVNEKNKLLNESDILNILKNTDIICIKSQSYSARRPVKTWLVNHNKMPEMNDFLSFAKLHVGIDYYNSCMSLLNGSYHCLGNMFITKKALIDEYCQFIFPLLDIYKQFAVFNKRNLSKRIIGYFAEFLFGAWLNMKNKKIYFNKLRMI